MDFILNVAGITLFFVIWSLIEQKFLVTTTYLISSTKLAGEFDDTAFVVLADLHNHSFGKQNERLIRKIEALEPNFIIIAGDMITKKSKGIPNSVFSLMESLSKKYMIYYAYGNHEQYLDNSHNKLYSTWVEYKKTLSNIGVIFLNNKGITITKNQEKIRITGATVDHIYYERKNTLMMQQGYLDTLVGKREEDTFQILIAHNPIYFKEYVSWGADLTLAGHLHGGLLRIPFLGGMVSPQVKLFPKYTAGRFTENGQDMIVSRGLGSHSAMFRLFNQPELIYIKLKSIK